MIPTYDSSLNTDNKQSDISKPNHFTDNIEMGVIIELPWLPW